MRRTRWLAILATLLCLFWLPLLGRPAAQTAVTVNVIDYRNTVQTSFMTGYNGLGLSFSLKNLPKKSTLELQYLRPDTSLAGSLGDVSFGNAADMVDSNWWYWMGTNLDVPGTWNLALVINGKTVATRPFQVTQGSAPTALIYGVNARYAPQSVFPVSKQNQTVGANCILSSLPKQSSLQYRIARPDGSNAANSGPLPVKNDWTGVGTWAGDVLPVMLDVPGVWTVQVDLNGTTVRTVPLAVVTVQNSSTADFCSADVLHATQAVSAGGDGLTARWSVTPGAISGTADPAAGSGLTAAGKAVFDFHLTNLPAGPPPSQFLLKARPALTFNVASTLLDGAADGANTLWQEQQSIAQSAIGSARQEYVDHPGLVVPPRAARVPDAADFQAGPFAEGLNGGDYPNAAIVSTWATATLAGVNAAARKRRLIPAGKSLAVTSVYRNPGRQWNAGAADGDTLAGSYHMWGRAIDFTVAKWSGKGAPGVKDWQNLANICMKYGTVLSRSKSGVGHVHVQK